MPFAPDESALAVLLPGTWRIGATNFVSWLGGDRLVPTVDFELRSTDPLVLDDAVRFTTAAGIAREIRGVIRCRPRTSGFGSPDTSEFTQRKKGFRLPLARRFTVVGATTDSTIAVFRFAPSMIGPVALAPAGVNVLVREGTDSHSFRSEVAGLSGSLGLTDGEFASLTWLEFPDHE